MVEPPGSRMDSAVHSERRGDLGDAHCKSAWRKKHVHTVQSLLSDTKGNPTRVKSWRGLPSSGQNSWR